MTGQEAEAFRSSSRLIFASSALISTANFNGAYETMNDTNAERGAETPAQEGEAARAEACRCLRCDIRETAAHAVASRQE